MEALGSRTQATGRARSGRVAGANPGAGEAAEESLPHLRVCFAAVGGSRSTEGLQELPWQTPSSLPISTGLGDAHLGTSSCWQPLSRTALSVQRRVGAPLGRTAVLRRIGTRVRRDVGRHPVHGEETSGWRRLERSRRDGLRMDGQMGRDLLAVARQGCARRDGDQLPGRRAPSATRIHPPRQPPGADRERLDRHPPRTLIAERWANNRGPPQVNKRK
jgi:hypothetical protein